METHAIRACKILCLITITSLTTVEKRLRGGTLLVVGTEARLPGLLLVGLPGAEALVVVVVEVAILSTTRRVSSEKVGELRTSSWSHTTVSYAFILIRPAATLMVAHCSLIICAFFLRALLN